MSLLTSWTAVIGGAAGAGTILLLVLAVALVYAHGRYIPLWLPDLGTVGVYVLQRLWKSGMDFLFTFALASLLVVTIGYLLHRYLLLRFVNSRDYLGALLVGLGLAFSFQGVASLLGSGLSEHFPANILQKHLFVDAFGLAIYNSDLVGLTLGLSVSVGLYCLLQYGRFGVTVRAVISNREWANSLGLPVRRVDFFLVAMSAVLALGSAFLYGNRFDLQPSMMFYPGLTAIAAAVTGGLHRPFMAVPIVCALVLAETLTGLSPSFAHLQRAVPFVVLIVVLISRAYLGGRKEEAPA